MQEAGNWKLEALENGAGKVHYWATVVNLASFPGLPANVRVVSGVIVAHADSLKAWSETSREVDVESRRWVGVALRACVVQRFSLARERQERRSGSGHRFLEPQNSCTTAAASSPIFVHEREPLHNNPHTRSATPTGVSYVYLT